MLRSRLPSFSWSISTILWKGLSAWSVRLWLRTTDLCESVSHDVLMNAALRGFQSFYRSLRTYSAFDACRHPNSASRSWSQRFGIPSLIPEAHFRVCGSVLQFQSCCLFYLHLIGQDPRIATRVPDSHSWSDNPQQELRQQLNNKQKSFSLRVPMNRFFPWWCCFRHCTTRGVCDSFAAESDLPLSLRCRTGCKPLTHGLHVLMSYTTILPSNGSEEGYLKGRAHLTCTPCLSSVGTRTSPPTLDIAAHPLAHQRSASLAVARKNDLRPRPLSLAMSIKPYSLLSLSLSLLTSSFRLDYLSSYHRPT